MVFTRCTLWLAQDHLLAVDWHGYSEEYKRFYFRDIQAITLRRTHRTTIVSLILLLVLALIAGIALLVENESPGSWPGFLVPGAVFAIWLVIHLLLGPSCRTHLRTAVHDQMLPSLNRVRVARGVVARLQPLIAAAQGEVSAEMLQAGVPEVPPALRPSLQAGQKQAHHEAGKGHVLLFALLTGFGVWQAADYFAVSLLLTLLSLLFGFGAAVATIVALVRQHNSDVPAGLKRLTIGAAVYCGLGFVLGYAQFIVMLASSPAMLQSQASIYRKMIEMDPQSNAFLAWSLAIEALLAIALGLAGWLTANRWRRQHAVTPES